MFFFFVATFVALFVAPFVATFVALFVATFVAPFVATFVAPFVALFVALFVATFVALFIAPFVATFFYACANTVKRGQRTLDQPLLSKESEGQRMFYILFTLYFFFFSDGGSYSPVFACRTSYWKK